MATSTKDWTIVSALIGVAAVFIAWKMSQNNSGQQQSDIPPGDLALQPPAVGASSPVAASVSPTTQPVTNIPPQSNRWNKWRNNVRQIWQAATTPPTATMQSGCGGCNACQQQQQQASSCKQRTYHAAPPTPSDVTNLQTGTAPSTWAPEPIGVPLTQIQKVPSWNVATYLQGGTDVNDYPNVNNWIQ